MSGLRPYAVFAAVALAAVLAYLPSFAVPFQFDDYGRIIDNQPLQKGDLLGGIAWLGASRPIPSATIALNYRAGGEDTFGYHLVNLVIHLLATLGVFRLALLLCATPAVARTPVGARALELAALGALVFACHPIQTQAVTYIIQRSTAMSAMFYVWSIASYVEARNRAAAGRPAGVSYAACALLGICAVLSKENAVTLPLAIALAEGAFFGWRAKIRKAAPLAALAFAVLAVAVGWKAWTSRAMKGDLSSLPWYAQFAEGLLAQGAPDDLRVTALEYGLTQTTVLPRYLGLVVAPVALNVDHDVAVQRSATVAVAAGVAALGALALFGFFALPRWPIAGFGILFFFVAASVESSVLPIADLMMEHRMYLAMPGIALAAAAFFLRIAPGPRSLGALAIALTVLLSSLTFARNRVWQTPLSLWGDALTKSPRKARVHVNVGVAYHGLKRLDDAIRHYCMALELDPDIAVARDNLEVALDEQGRLDGVVDELMKSGQKVAKKPDGSLIVEYDVAKVACPPVMRQARAGGETNWN